MPTPVECVCCKEITATANKCETASSDEPVMCITEHEGFDAVCLNVWVLKLAFSVTVTTTALVMLEIPLHMSKLPRKRI